MNHDAPIRPRVLVVDDEAPLRELIAVTLGDDFECIQAPDGETALELLDEVKPDLVFLDVMLPGKSGLDVLEEMRADEQMRDVPVVIVSAWQTPDDVTRALEKGADEFIGKPFLVDDLASLAQTLLERRR